MQVQLVTPTSLNAETFEAFKFTKENVKAIVKDDIMCGYYRIGTIWPKMDGREIVGYYFRVCYFGRSDQNDYTLQQRICDHLDSEGSRNEKNVYDDQMYFAAWNCNSSYEAFKMESTDYETFFAAPGERNTGYGYLDDPRYSHNARSVTTNGRPMRNHVFVDNENKPAWP